MNRWTQTNEAARTGVILPVLARIPGEIALIEAGASAGLCLYPDRYRIIHDDNRAVGPPDSTVHLHLEASGPVSVPDRALKIVSRTGLDRNPLNVVFHSAVLNYLDGPARQAFIAAVRAHLRAVWISNEGPGVIDPLRTDMRPPESARSKAYFVLAVNGKRVEAISDPHGRWLRWCASGPVA